MNELEKLLADFYSKYSPNNTPDSARIAKIKEKYGEDYDGLISDLYTKYAPDNIPDSERLGKIKQKYQLSTPTQAPTEGAFNEFGQPLPITTEEPQSIQMETNPLVTLGKKFLQTIGFDLPANTLAAGATVANTPEDLTRIAESNQELYGLLNSGELLGKEATQEEEKLIGMITKAESSYGKKLEEIAAKYSPNTNGELSSEEYHKYLNEINPIEEEYKELNQKVWDRIDFIRGQRNEGTIPSGVREGAFRTLKANLFRKASERQKEGQQYSADLIDSMSEASTPLEWLNWASSAVGQAAGQIPASVGTVGISSMSNQIGSIYLEGIQQKAEELGITPEEVIQKDLDDPASAIGYGLVSAAPDALSAGTIINRFTKNLNKKSLRSFITGLGDNSFESATEGLQTVLEQKGAGKDFDFNEVAEAMAQAFVGSAGITGTGSVIGAVQNKAKTKTPVQETQETINEATEGIDPEAATELDVVTEDVINDIDNEETTNTPNEPVPGTSNTSKPTDEVTPSPTEPEVSPEFKAKKTKYENKFGNVLDTDNAKKLEEDDTSEPTGTSKETDTNVSSFISELYKDKLEAPAEEGQQNKVVLVTGGIGAGKSSVDFVNTQDAQIVYNTPDVNKEQIKLALNAGKIVDINYVHRDPVKSFTEGVISEASKTGKAKTIREIAKSHVNSRKSIETINTEYETDPKVNIQVVDNTGKLGDDKQVRLDELPKQEYTAKQLEKELNTIADRLYEDGEISEEVYAQLKGKTVEDIQANKEAQAKRARNKTISGILDSVEDISPVDDAAVKKEITKAGNKLEDKLSEKEIESSVKLYNKRKEEVKSTNELKGTLKKNVIESPRYKSSEFYKTYVDDYLAINPLKLKGQKRSLYVRGLGQLMREGEYDDLVASLVMQEAAKGRVADITSDPGFKYKTVTDGWGALNPAQLVTYMSKFVTSKADKMMQTFYANIMRANAQAQLATEKLLIGKAKKDNSLFQISKRNKLKPKDHIKTYLYGKLQTNGKGVNVGDSEFKGILESNIKQERKEIQNKLEAVKKGIYKKQSVEQVQEELDILDELQNDFSINTKQKELYDRFKEILSSYEDDAALNTRAIWGKEFTKLTNYMPTFALGKTNETELSTTADSLVDLLDATPEKMNAISSVQSGFTKGRKRTDNVYYDNNILSVASKYITSTVFDINATREIKILNRVLKSEQLINHLGLNNVMALKRGLEGNIKSAVKKGNDFHELVKAAEYVKNALVVGRMGTAGQLAVQFLATMPSSLIYTNPKSFGKAVKSLFKFNNTDSDVHSLKEFMEKHGLGIQVRDVLFEKFESVEDFNKTKINQVFKSLGAVSDATTTGVLRWSDKQAARLTWLAAFYEAGGDLNKPTIEAVTAAERKTMLLQNVSDVTFAPSLFKTDNQYKRLIISETMAFKSFALQQMLNTYNAIPHVFNKPEARKILAANVTNSLMYSAVSVLLITPFYEMLGNLFSGEDEDDDKEFTKGQQVFTNTVFDIFFSGYPGFAESFLKLQINKYISPALYGDGEDKFNKYSQSPIYGPNTVKETFFSGPYSDLVEMIDRNIELSSRAAGEDEEIPQHELNSMMFVDAMSVIKVVPFRGEIIKIANKYAKDVKKSEREKGSSPNLFAEPPTPRRPRTARPRANVRPKLTRPRLN